MSNQEELPVNQQTEKIKQFIVEELLEEVREIDASTELLASGLIDSLGILQLANFVEEEFEFTVPPEDFLLENFSSINAMLTYLKKRTP